MFNRLPYFTPPDESLLSRADGIKLELLRYTDPDDPADTENLINYEIRGTLADDDAPLLARLLAEFKQSPKEGGAV